MARGPRKPRQAQKYHAVWGGREGTRIYSGWEEARKNVHGFSGAVHKSFKSKERAEGWIAKLTERLELPPGVPRPPEEYIPALQWAKAHGWLNANIPLDNHVPPVQQPTPPHTPPQPLPGTQTALSSLQTGPVDDKSMNPEYDSPLRCLRQPYGSAPPPPSPPSDIQLSSEQRQILDRVIAGGNVFFTGSAGTGKSVLLREIVKWYRAQGKRLHVTASTGIASVNVGGTTLHSWAGVGLGKEPAEVLVMRILGKDKYIRRKNREARKRCNLPPEPEDEGQSDGDCQPRVVEKWRQCDAIIIDEISMVDGKFFDKLEFIARVLRKNQKPFGGIQLIISGDFFQLPPVPDEEKQAKIQSTYAFDADSWNRCIGRPVTLHKVFRQKDQEFVNMLNAMRLGDLDAGTIQTFMRLSRRVVYTDDIEPTDLYATRKEVDSQNCYRLARLKTQAYSYEALDLPGWDDELGQHIPRKLMEKLLERLVAQQSISLKEGAQVMLIKNLVQGTLVNGSIGKVVGFMTTREAIKNNILVGLLPPSGVTNEPDDIQTLRVENRKYDLRDRKKGSINAKDRYAHIPAELRNSPRRWPLVTFNQGSQRCPTTDLLCVPNVFEVNNCQGRIEATREQVPLILAWALSIHKSQGQTLERVRVDIKSVFEKGQAYVALSRATNLETLEVRNFDPAKVKAHPRVKEWARENMLLEELVLPDADKEMDELFQVVLESELEQAKRSAVSQLAPL